MSDFDTFCTAAFAAAKDIFGEVTFTVDGITGNKTGVLDKLVTSKNLRSGGFLPMGTPTLEAGVAQFATAPQPGANVTIGVELYRIPSDALVENDGITYRIPLEPRV